jgi:hypothetical protein
MRFNHIEVYWRRPQAYLNEEVRSAISTFSRMTDFEDGLQALAKDLNSGVWYQRYGSFLNREEMDFGYRIVVYDKKKPNSG